MNYSKTLRILQTLDSIVLGMCNEVDSFVGNVIQWANELEEIVEKEYSTSKGEDSLFLLPKTPCEKKTRNGKTKQTLVSKNTLVNHTFVNDTTDLDNTIASRTRAGKKQHGSKVSQQQDSTDQQQVLAEVKSEVIENEKNKEIMSNATFVLQDSNSTRTKPVVNKKQHSRERSVLQTTATEESNNSKSQTAATEDSNDPTLQTKDKHPDLNSWNRKSEKGHGDEKVSRVPSRGTGGRESRGNISRTYSDTTTHRQSRSIFSRTFSESPVRNNSKDNACQVPNSDAAVGTSQNVPELSDSLPLEPPTKRKVSRALSESPVKRPSKFSKTFCKDLVEDESNNSKKSTTDKNAVTLYPTIEVSKCSSPVKRSTRIATFSGKNLSPLSRSSSIPSLVATGLAAATALVESGKKADSPTALVECSSLYDKTETFANAASTFVIDEKGCENGSFREIGEKTPKISGGKIKRLSKTSTPITDREKTLLFDDKIDGLDYSSASPEGESIKMSDVPKNKGKTKKTKKSEEKVEEMGETMRITRTKSKAMKEKLQEGGLDAKQQEDLSAFAKLVLNKAKINSHKKNKLAAVFEHYGTPRHFSGIKLDGLQSGILLSKTKCQMLLSSAKKPKTPLATLPNSTVKRPKLSDKDRLRLKVTKRDSSVENLKSATKAKRVLANENKLKTNKDKEDEATRKRQKVMQSKQEELKRKNELKHQLALKQREKLVQEKYNNMIQSEKEKEERHKLILQERQIKQKEEVNRKRMLKQQKIAEAVERRRLEEEARLAKIREMEAEEQRLALERQKEQERQEKWEQEQLALKKAKEEYELQRKQEMEAERLRAEKRAAATSKKYVASASKMHSASKKPIFGILNDDRKDWDYKPRNEFDYGLDGENSELDSDDEKPSNNTRPTPAWAQKVMNHVTPMLPPITLEMLCEYMQCSHKTPDINKMFNMTPTKRIKRTSSAIWNTPTS